MREDLSTRTSVWRGGNVWPKMLNWNKFSNDILLRSMNKLTWLFLLWLSVNLNGMENRNTTAVCLLSAVYKLKAFHGTLQPIEFF